MLGEIVIVHDVGLAPGTLGEPGHSLHKVVRRIVQFSADPLVSGIENGVDAQRLHGRARDGNGRVGRPEVLYDVESVDRPARAIGTRVEERAGHDHVACLIPVVGPQYPRKLRELRNEETRPCVFGKVHGPGHKFSDWAQRHFSFESGRALFADTRESLENCRSLFRRCR